MGLVTSGWDIWGGFAATVTQVLGDAYGTVVSDVADSTADWIGGKFDDLLQQIKIDEEYSFHVIPGLDWTLVKADINLEISQSDRNNIVTPIPL